MLQDLMAEKDEVSAVVGAIRLQRYSQLVAVVIALYDHFLTFDQELELIWKKRWSKSKVLYFLCRYVGNLLIFLETFVFVSARPTYELLKSQYVQLLFSCVLGTRADVPLAITFTWTTQLIMQFRIQALYNNKILSKCLSAVFIGEVVGLITLGFVLPQEVIMTHEPLPGIYQCIFLKFSPHSFVFWVPILFFDTLMFVLAVGIAVRNWRQLPQGSVSERIGISLVTILLRDNFGYSFVACGIYLTTMITWLSAEFLYYNIPSCFSHSILTVMGCRLILNLCDAYHNHRSYVTRGATEWDTKPLEFNTIQILKSTTNSVTGAAATVYSQNTVISGSEDGMELSIVSGLAERENQPKELTQHTQA